MQQIIKYRATDGKEFESSADCTLHERRLEAAEAIRAEYAVVLRTGRVDAVVAGITIDPEPMLRILTDLLRPEPAAEGSTPAPRRPMGSHRTDAQLKADL